MMALKLFSCDGGSICLPPSPLLNRQDGGNLWVIPPREVWDRSELTPVELMFWSFLVAATGRAMLEVLPQLKGGCINYWDAGNWALNHQAEPKGPKDVSRYKKVHMHLLGRSRTATDACWKWGESPKFPEFAESKSWATRYENLQALECRAVVIKTAVLLKEKYAMRADQIAPWLDCTVCRYPTAVSEGRKEVTCARCVSSA